MPSTASMPAWMETALAAVAPTNHQTMRLAGAGSPAARTLTIGQVRSVIRDAMDNSIAPADREAGHATPAIRRPKDDPAILFPKGRGEDILRAPSWAASPQTTAAKERMASGTRGKAWGLGDARSAIEASADFGDGGNRLAKSCGTRSTGRVWLQLLLAGHLANSPGLARRMVAKDAKALAKALCRNQFRANTPKSTFRAISRARCRPAPQRHHWKLDIVGGSPILQPGSGRAT